VDTRFIVDKFNKLVLNTENYLKNERFYDKYRNDYRKNVMDYCIELIKLEELKNSEISETIIKLYDIFENNNNNYNSVAKLLESNKIMEEIKVFIKNIVKQGYGDIIIEFEYYKLKILLYYEDENQDAIAYMAGSFYTDQEYRAFLANIQKGLNRITFNPNENQNSRIYDLKTIKNGYVSRVKKAINQNTQDGYHADFVLNNDRFFLLKKEDNPIDIIYKWITKNIQAGVLPEWKTYLYNALNQHGHIKKCKGYNYTDIELEGIVLTEEVTTELIREIRKEGLELGEISIPRKPVELDPSLSFLDVMNKFVIPHITERKSLYNVGEELSSYIESPIIFKKDNKLKKTSLFPRQKVMAQGLLNAIKKGRTSVLLNGGMGVGKTFISVKLSYAIIKEHFKKDNGRIAVYAQGHILPKWEREFKEALPDVNLKFIKIDNYKDIEKIQNKTPEGIEVYLLPKDKVKRNYLETYAAHYKYKLSSKFYKNYNQIVSIEEKREDKGENIFIVNDIKPSEMKILSLRLEKSLKRWICIAKEFYDDEGKTIGYRVATSSKLLKEKLGDTGTYYDFYVSTLSEIEKYKSFLEEEIILEKTHTHSFEMVCPTCGGPIYDKESDQLSEDDYKNILYLPHSTKSDRNKKCTNYIKIDGTPLTQKERIGIIKGDVEHIFEGEFPYIDSENNPITEPETIQSIKQGRYEEHYTIVLKKCDTPLWTAEDKKGYRTVNSIDLLKKRFGKGFFDCNISDEAHLYSAESSQGETFGKLCSMSKTNIALTGTLTGGKSSHLFYTLYRMVPSKMSKHYKYNEITKFIDHYGRRKKVTKEYKNDGKYNKCL